MAGALSLVLLFSGFVVPPRLPESCAAVMMFNAHGKTFQAIFKQLLMLMSPVVALTAWALITSRANPKINPLIPLAPVQLDETHIKVEVTRQVTKQLINKSWVSAGNGYKFVEFNAQQCHLDLPHGQIKVGCMLITKTRRPAESRMGESQIYIESLLQRNKAGSRYVGKLGVPGAGVPNYIKVPIVIPIK